MTAFHMAAIIYRRDELQFLVFDLRMDALSRIF